MGILTQKLNKLFLSTNLQLQDPAVDQDSIPSPTSHALALEAASALDDARSPPPGLSSHLLIQQYISTHPHPRTSSTFSSSPTSTPPSLSTSTNDTLTALSQIQNMLRHEVMDTIRFSSCSPNPESSPAMSEIEEVGEEVLHDLEETVKCIQYRLVVQGRRSEEASMPVWGCGTTARLGADEGDVLGGRKEVAEESSTPFWCGHGDITGKVKAEDYEALSRALEAVHEFDGILV